MEYKCAVQQWMAVGPDNCGGTNALLAPKFRNWAAGSPGSRDGRAMRRFVNRLRLDCAAMYA